MDDGDGAGAPGPGEFAERTAAGLRLRIRLTPGGSADRIEGLCEAGAAGWALAARVRAVPEQGLANAALIRLIAGAAGWPKSALALDAGSRSRLKVLQVSGAPERLAEGLGRLREAAELRGRRPATTGRSTGP